MKAFVIILLIANVALFGWRFNEHLHARALATAAAPELPADAPSLQLVSELPVLPPRRQLERTAGDGTQAVESTVVQAVDLSTEINSSALASDICVDIGPLADQQSVTAVREWLRTRTTLVHTRAETVRERRYFWIYLEPASDEQARKNLNDLARRGVKDYMLIRRGGLKNAISLGLFRSQDSVNRRLAEMTEKGYKPVVVPQFETTENFWIRATMATGFADTDPLAALLPDGATLTERTCAAATTATNSP
tara:strand:- start:2408 stop:3160 length:753 start_codon:yes stop_codon:yes gene_type:complete